eukprot:11312973-Ditylum_brightwellii.AAC.1
MQSKTISTSGAPSSNQQPKVTPSTTLFFDTPPSHAGWKPQTMVWAATTAQETHGAFNSHV